MSNEKNATPPKELERQIMSSLVTKNEREHWACGEIESLRQQLAEYKGSYENACNLVARMHAAAVGEVTGPRRGVVEDVEDLRQQLALWKEAAAEKNLVIERLKAREDALIAELKCINYAINDLRVDLTITAAEAITELRQQVTLLRDFATKISKQIPEKPDYWSSCSQCEYNSRDAEEIIEALATTEPKL